MRKFLAITGLISCAALGGCMQTGSYGYTGYGSPPIVAKPVKCLPPLTQYCRHPDSMPEHHNATQF